MKNEDLENFKRYLELSAMLVGWLIFAGGVVVCTYCLAEGIQPRNLSVSDTLILLYALFSFLVICGVSAAMGTASSIWVLRMIQLFAKKRGAPNVVQFIWPQLAGWTAGVTSFVLSLMFALSSLSTKSSIEYRNLLWFFFINGFYLAIFYLNAGPKLPPTRIKIRISIGLFLATLLLLSPKLLDLTFSAISIRSAESDVIQLDEKSQKELGSQFKNIHRAWIACPSADGVHWITTDIQVIWTGIGDTTFVRLVGRGDSNIRHTVNPLMSIETSSIKVIRGARPLMECGT